jgi:small-conductance mechanosensitive channel
VLRSELNYAIIKKFREEGIEIPFPQRDIHIRNGGEEAEGAASR